MKPAHNNTHATTYTTEATANANLWLLLSAWDARGHAGWGAKGVDPDRASKTRPRPVNDESPDMEPNWRSVESLSTLERFPDTCVQHRLTGLSDPRMRRTDRWLAGANVLRFACSHCIACLGYFPYVLLRTQYVICTAIYQGLARVAPISQLPTHDPELRG
ncbi:hypothetical protein F5Y08DRAFT_231246 [Xylaria arbuscula]|nr:hypothetical protein F5Y08DRAFT_231246 [Xylaria arbuscula]